MSDVSKILTRAADLIRRYGWVQYQKGNRYEGFCLVGAVINASGEEWRSVPAAHDRLIDTLGSRELAAWNDHPDRTEEEVLELLERASRYAKSS